MQESCREFRELTEKTFQTPDDPPHRKMDRDALKRALTHPHACGECEAWVDSAAGRFHGASFADPRLAEIVTELSALEAYWLWEAYPLNSEIDWCAVWIDALNHLDDPGRVARAEAMKTDLIHHVAHEECQVCHDAERGMKEPKTEAEVVRLRDFLLSLFADLMREEAEAQGGYVTVDELQAEEDEREAECRKLVDAFVAAHPEMAFEKHGLPADFPRSAVLEATEGLRLLIRRAIEKPGRAGIESDVVLLDDGSLHVAGRPRVAAEAVRLEAARFAELWTYEEDTHEIEGMDPAAAALVTWLVRAARVKPHLFRRFVAEPLTDGRDGVRLTYVGKDQSDEGWGDV